jgi:hypothetical protein
MTSTTREAFWARRSRLTESKSYSPVTFQVVPIFGRCARRVVGRSSLCNLLGNPDANRKAQQVVDILKKEGRAVDAHFYANEGHGFVKRENQIDSIRRTIDWFDKYLKGKKSNAAN